MRRNRTEFGDFQTPLKLAEQVCNFLAETALTPSSIIEPTCGTGSFLVASKHAFPDCKIFLGYEINQQYVCEAQSAMDEAVIHNVDFFTINWHEQICSLPEPILVVGNPPWVTNSAVGAVDGNNLPQKSNFHKLRGLDAKTGKSNFDISEWMLTHLLDALSGRSAVLAMLSKTSVARKVLQHAWHSDIPIARSATYSIDAHGYFGAAVDACLLICVLEPGADSKTGADSKKCDVFKFLGDTEVNSTFALRDGKLIADLSRHNATKHLRGGSPLRWRSGIKHDCSRIMELYSIGEDHYTNGLGENIKLEPDYLYPMLKSSELVKDLKPSRFMLVPQRTTGEDTSELSAKAPLTWHYLKSHEDIFDSRSSSIYRNRPPFSIFGVGEYSFAPWKVAISGFYKTINFRCVSSIDSKPVVLDDTCYFLPCQSEEEARELALILNTDIAKNFFESYVFWDAKRPITASLLGSLDLGLLAAECQSVGEVVLGSAMIPMLTGQGRLDTLIS